MQTVRWLILLLLFALPITFFPFSYLAFELPKIFLLYLFSILAVYFLLISGYKLNHLTKIHYLLFILLGWIILSSILGLSFQQSFLGSYFRIQGILTWICYGLLFLISGKVFEEDHLKKQACLAILTSSVAVAFLAATQFISLWFFGNSAQLLYSNRVISTFGQPNFLGAYLVMSLPFVWFSLKHHLSSRRMSGSNNLWIPAPQGYLLLRSGAFAGMTMVLIVLGIFATTSRSAYIGLAVLALIWGVYHYKLLLAGLTFTIIIFAILANLFPNLVYEQWYRFQLDTVSKWTAENRLEIVRKSFFLTIQKPVTGYGLENFALAFPRVVNTQDLGLKDIVVDSSHNLFLDLTVQLGLVGLIIFLSFLILTFIKGLKRIKTSPEADFLKINMGAVIAFLVIHQFSPVSTAPMVLMWLALGVINGSSMKQANLTKMSKLFVNFLGGALIIIVIFFMIQTIRAEMLFRQANAYEVPNINYAIKLDNEAIQLAPWIRFYQIRRNFLLKQLGF